MMETTSTLPRSGKKFTRRWTITSIAAIVLALVYCGYRVVLRRAVDAELEAVREAQFPASTVELEAWYPEIASGENAAKAYLEACRQIRATDNASLGSFRDYLEHGDEALALLSARFPHGAREAMGPFLVANEVALRGLRRAAEMGRCRYPATLGRPDLDLAGAHRLLELEGVDAVFQRDRSRATDALVAALGLGRSLRTEPYAQSQFQALRFTNGAVQLLGLLINRLKPSASELQRLGDLLLRAENPEDLTLALVGERARAKERLARSDYSDTVAAIEWNVTVAQVLGFFYAASGAGDIDLRAYIELLTRALETAKLPGPHRREAFETITRDIEGRLTGFSICPLPFAIPSTLLDDTLHVTARLRAARTALAVERYRLTRNRLPGKLQDLVPFFLDVVPDDPLTGEPLRYRTLKKGFVVYSVGNDAIDGGGLDADRLFPADDDIAFAVVR